MKICLAQTKSDKGKIDCNIKHHTNWIEIALSEKADLIVFPELSLTAYEPLLAKELATHQNDSRLDAFQSISDLNKIAIGVGLPTRSESGILISMVVFQPERPRQTYSKQILHSDEKPYFIEGHEQTILTIKGLNIALAICYESLQPEHSEYANKLGADIYLASVAKSQGGIEKANVYFPKIADNYAMPVLMVNGLGYCDNFKSAGQTSVWDESGILLEQLDSQSEGIIIYDTDLNTTFRAGNTNAKKA